MVFSCVSGERGMKGMINLYDHPTPPPFQKADLSYLSTPRPNPPSTTNPLRTFKLAQQKENRKRLLSKHKMKTSQRKLRIKKNYSHFWHIADLHWDMYYGTKLSRCWRGRYDSIRKAGPMGNHACNSPWSLVESAVKSMAEIWSDVEFIILSGDIVSDEFKGEERMQGIQNVTDLFMRTFAGHFVFPVLGETDPLEYEKLATIWKPWMPNDAINTFIEGGFYMLELKQRKLKVIIMNTNLWTEKGAAIYKSSDPAGQWAWLESVLAKCDANNQMAYMVGHIAPGGDERQETNYRHRLLPEFNAQYIDLINKYSHIISGQFFSHLHSDTFRILFSKVTEEPISAIFLAPSVTPLRTPSGANNPGIRLYETEKVAGTIVNYEQYFLDLDEANKEGKTKWYKEYDLLSYYNFKNVTPQALHNLAQNFLRGEDRAIVFEKYWMANSVQGYKSPANISFANNHFCTITHLDYDLLKNCLSTRASPLAASHPGDMFQEKTSSATAVSSRLFVVVVSAVCALPSLFLLLLR